MRKGIKQLPKYFLFLSIHVHYTFLAVTPDGQLVEAPAKKNWQRNQTSEIQLVCPVEPLDGFFYPNRISFRNQRQADVDDDLHCGDFQWNICNNDMVVHKSIHFLKTFKFQNCTRVIRKKVIKRSE